MRLPQVSSNSTAVMGPMLFGSPRKLTPSALRRRYSAWMSFVRNAVGWNASGKQGLLISLSRCETDRLQHELDAFRALRRRHGQITKLTHRYVLVFHEAQYGRIEAESVLLVVNHYAGQPDLHGGLLFDVVERSRRKCTTF